MKKKEPGIKNIYMELGSTFGQLVTTNPTACAHSSGRSSTPSAPTTCCGERTRSGTGRRNGRSRRSGGSRFPRRSIDQHGYAQLTRPVKEQIFGLNAARVFGVDVNAKRNELPKDYVSRIKMAYLDEGPAPSHRWYGWIA